MAGGSVGPGSPLGQAAPPGPAQELHWARQGVVPAGYLTSFKSAIQNVCNSLR